MMSLRVCLNKNTKSQQMSVNVKISGHEVSDRDVQGALAHSRGAVQHGRDELVHVIAAGYALDGQRGINDPRGMTGQSLDVLLSPVTAQSTALRNITAALHQNHLDGFAIISRGSSATSPEGSFATILSDVAGHAEDLLADEFSKTRLDPALAPMYAQMLVGLVALTGQWWLDNREDGLAKDVVAAHLVNLAWNGMRHLQPEPRLARPTPADEADDRTG